ncbi:MAG: hypothetical protein J7605_26750 [Variovorax sp.]|nr:hypothetical protein [Variovorax sp.]
MHSAPSVSYPVGRSRNADHLLLALWGIGGAAAIAACLQSAAMGWRGAVLLLCAIVAACAAWRARLSSAGPARLVFDGQYWSMPGRPEVHQARANVMLDLQVLLLIRLTVPMAPARWLWAERRALPPGWRDLRRALYSRASPAEAAILADAASAHAQHPSP